MKHPKNSLTFHVGPFPYRAVVSDRPIYMRGEPCEGLAVERRRLLILSPHLRRDRREEVCLHELGHAHLFHLPAPRTPEDRCQFFALTAAQFRRDIEAQGGGKAFLKLTPRRVDGAGGRPIGEWISPERVAAKLSITSRTAHRLIAAGKLKAVEWKDEQGKRVRRIELVALERFLIAQTMRRHKCGKEGRRAI